MYTESAKEQSYGGGGRDCNGGGRREGGPACSGRATARWTMAGTRKEPPGSRGLPRRTTVRGRPEGDTPSDGGAMKKVRIGMTASTFFYLSRG